MKLERQRMQVHWLTSEYNQPQLIDSQDISPPQSSCQTCCIVSAFIYGSGDEH